MQHWQCEQNCTERKQCLNPEPLQYNRSLPY